MKEKIKDYLNETIVTKRSQRKIIGTLEEKIKILEEEKEDAVNNEQHAIDRMNKFKDQFVEEHNTTRKLEEEINTLKEEHEKEVKELNKEIKKLERELKKCQVKEK